MTAPNNPPSQPLSEQTEVQSQHRVNKSMTALGITGLVLSSIAVLISWVPIVNNFAAILGPSLCRLRLQVSSPLVAKAKELVAA